LGKQRQGEGEQGARERKNVPLQNVAFCLSQLFGFIKTKLKSYTNKEFFRKEVKKHKFSQ